MWTRWPVCLSKPDHRPSSPIPTVPPPFDGYPFGADEAKRRQADCGLSKELILDLGEGVRAVDLTDCHRAGTSALLAAFDATAAGSTTNALAVASDCRIAKAGGGDNVKHGDLALSLANTTREYDVHMGTDGGDLECVDCHAVQRDLDGNLLSHGIGGMPYHSTDEGVMRGCDDCHGSAANIHAGTPVAVTVNSHPTLACQVCHIPEIARKISTKTEWYWSDAGQDISPIPTDPVTGRPTYDKKKGTFVWENDVRPTLLYFDGKWDRMLIKKNDRYTELPGLLGYPPVPYTTPGAMIYPFKKMIGNQPADAGNETMLVPHLFGTKGGPNPYWGKFDWDLALRDGADYTGQTYTGAFDFVDTVMYLSVNHEVAPSEMAYGYDNGGCTDCHFSNQIEWTALGWTGDPADGGELIP